MLAQPSVIDTASEASDRAGPYDLEEELQGFSGFGSSTRVGATAAVVGRSAIRVPTYTNEFWTSKQRVAHSLHEISYRACFKPQLPRFFIERLTEPGQAVYDPFMGRGTTVLEAALLGRVPIGCDVNPLSRLLIEPRLAPPAQDQVARRLAAIGLSYGGERDDDLLAFYHPDTLDEIHALRDYLLGRELDGTLDPIDRWIRLVALNRLTGHSNGFFSVYTLPPNQAVSVKSQRTINERRRQVPPYRNVRDVILRKSRALLRDCDRDGLDRLRRIGEMGRPLTGDAASTPEIASSSVALVVTSPPFLDVVDYAGDNWLRCWFCGIDPLSVPIIMHRKLEEWQGAMTRVIHELGRVLAPGGRVAFEVGEVRNGTVRLEEAVIPCGMAAGLRPRLVLINDQPFTKTANCWGVVNGRKGTNTNRIVLFQKDG